MKDSAARWVIILILLLAFCCSLGVAASERSTVRINEVAWSGAAWDATAEWIELVNTTDETIDLDGWRLVSSDGAPDIALGGLLSPRAIDIPRAGYFLLERDDDRAVPAWAADLIYHGALNDDGETLTLFDADGHTVDTANAPPTAASRWPAGTDRHGTPPYASMERVDPGLEDEPGNWATSTAPPPSDESERPIQGTPGVENAVFNVAPVPVLLVEPRQAAPGGVVRFDATGSSDANDRIAAYRWEFGDGSYALGATTEHTYAEVGQYRVVLVVIDGKGGRAELEHTVRIAAVTRPVADFTVMRRPADRVLRTGTAIAFQDESSIPDSGALTRLWDFGDGTEASGTHVVHTYEAAGDYIVALRVIDTQGGGEALQTQSLRIASQLPEAAFAWRPERPTAEELVRFDAHASIDPDGRIECYLWDFDGDGAFEHETTTPIAEHAFPFGGPVDVRLQVIDDAGERSSDTVAQVEVNRPPIAQFSLSTFETDELSPLHFKDASHDPDGRIVAWSWAFEDGATSKEQSPEHVYSRSGTYSTSLTVTDNHGAERTTIAQVTIVNLAPIATLTTDPKIRPTGEPFELDASGSIDPSPCGSIAKYEWDLDGDGAYDISTTEPRLRHVFEEDGIYPVTVRVTDDDAASTVSDPLSLTVRNRPPRVLLISWDPKTPNDNEAVTFAASPVDPDGSVAHWSWRLGDARSADPAPSVLFPDDGRYPVRLIVEDDDGASSEPFAVEVDVANTPPIPDFTWAHTGGYCVEFDATASVDPSPEGGILHVAWDFGDGTSCPGTPEGCPRTNRWMPVHCFPGPGSYDVVLAVVDDDGALRQLRKTLEIAE